MTYLLSRPATDPALKLSVTAALSKVKGGSGALQHAVQQATQQATADLLQGLGEQVSAGPFEGW